MEQIIVERDPEGKNNFHATVRCDKISDIDDEYLISAFKNKNVISITFAECMIDENVDRFLRGASGLTDVLLLKCKMKSLSQESDSWRRVLAITLDGTQVGDSELAFLKDARSVERLSLSKCGVKGTFLEYVKESDKLWALELRENQLNDASLEGLKYVKSLMVLDISRNSVSDGGIPGVASCRQLKNLNLEDTKIMDLNLANLASMPALERLYLDGTSVTLEGLKVFRDSPVLKTLTASRCGLDVAAIQRICNSFKWSN